jgi:cobalt-zinc-cadmium efflux system membrane fusion protein
VLFALAGLVVWLMPGARSTLSALATIGSISAPKMHDAHGHAPGHGREDHKHGSEGMITLTPEQIQRAGLELAPIESGTLTRRLTVPGTVIPDSDRIGRVAAKVVGTVAELRKRLGDRVEKGEVIAVLESREVAEAKSEYLASAVVFDLQKTLFEREQALWDKKISAEQQYLRARAAFTDAQLKMNVARQKLSALDLTDAEVAALPSQPTNTLRHKEIRAPISGEVVERRVDLGAPVGGEGHEKELYVVADLSSVWLDLSVPLADLDMIRPSQPVTTGPDGRITGVIVFVSPVLHAETRTARVIAALDNRDRAVRPGTFLTAQIAVEQQSVDLRVPKAALQSIGGEQVVFVRTSEGFEKREIVLGKSDDRHAEVVFGLDPGEQIAVANTFILKAELGKSEADHGHAH